ncbi:Ig-like domain-containing protein [Candidatus Palauibacter sp.]|uniref:Ig-like domain-containing protein n=1 Tax=Candidatus Palauibacter sp. TaxID=3101350 RepID=UPI003B5ACE3C
MPARVTLEPAEVTVAAGDTVRVKATVYNDRAQPISDAAVTWTSGEPTIATVDGTGLVTGLKAGKASLTATSGPAATTAPVTVRSLDRATLIDLYDGASGPDWTNNTNWASNEPIGSWHGVAANAESRVTALRLSENGLKGRLPENLGDLAFLTELRLDGNAGLSGPIPFSLSELGIRTLHYGGTKLCTVRDEGFRAWLNAIPPRDGEFIACNEDREDLSGRACAGLPAAAGSTTAPRSRTRSPSAASPVPARSPPRSPRSRPVPPPPAICGPTTA